MSLEKKFVTGGGIGVTRNSQELPYKSATNHLVTALNTQRGVFLSSSFEYPKRYSRWDLGFTNPPIEIVARGRCMQITALNARGIVLLPAIYQALIDCPEQDSLHHQDQVITLNVPVSQQEFTEEQRSQQPSVFSILRRIIRLFAHKDDAYLGLYGAFGYELCFQFEAIKTSLKRSADARDMVLYIPDEIIAVDHSSKLAFCYQYEFEFNNQETNDKARDGESNVFALVANSGQDNKGTAFTSDHAPGEYADCVRKAIEYFARGDLYEVVPGQVFAQPCIDLPSEIFRRLKAANPAPYGALINLGEQEYLVAASPEMFVRVDGRRVETCPISGTIKRGRDPMEDTKQIIALLNSKKEESELTMCTDVDRNDKSRICEPGSIRLLGRRQIEIYSRLIHTVDHVEGILREGFDAIDGFLAHAWAVTVTGAPKQSAIQFIEDNEKSPRMWYGGAMGSFLFNGNVNTGLTLRTMRIKDGVAEVRAGATLLYDSDPDAEEAETHLKASALLGIINPANKPVANDDISFEQYNNNRKLVILMVDHQDSFVHTLGGYLRMTGASVITMRPKMARAHLAKESPDLLVLSPGPGRPSEYEMHETIRLAAEKKVPIFGVCLGLQGIVEYFGGSLRQLEHPMHGKPSCIRLVNEGIFKDLPETTFTAGRYHSLCANKVPATLKILATTEDDTVMAIQHIDLPIAAVQFHPESILSLENNVGHRLLVNMLSGLVGTT